MENLCAKNIHTILIPPVPGHRNPGLSSIWPLDALSPQLPDAHTCIRVIGLTSRSRPIWLYTSSQSPRPLGLSNNQFMDPMSSSDLGPPQHLAPKSFILLTGLSGSVLTCTVRTHPGQCSSWQCGHMNPCDSWSESSC